MQLITWYALEISVNLLLVLGEGRFSTDGLVTDKS